MTLPKTLKPWVLLGIVFATGIVVGVVGTRQFIRVLAHRVVNNPDVVRNWIEENYSKDLRLNATQRAQLHDILTRSHEQLKVIRRESEPRVMMLIETTNKEIKTILTPEQIERFDKNLDDKRSMLAPFIPGPIPPPETHK